MPWFFYAGMCALLLSGANLAEKHVLRKVHVIDFSASVALLNVIFSLPFLFFIDFKALNGFIILLISVVALISAAAFFLVNKGFRHLEVSTVAPLLALSPVSSSLLAFLILGEKVSPLQISGIVFMIIGSYILTTEPKKSLLDPFYLFLQSRYVHIVFLALFCYAVISIFDRTILHGFSVAIPAYIFFLNFFIALVFIPISGIFGVGFKGVLIGFREGGWRLVVASIFTVLYRLFEMQALVLAPVALVSGIKRTSSLFTTVIGGEMFHERNLSRKIVASLIIIAGTVLVVI
jgi:drug/metabolite transporter (DMT)-like permease